MWQCRGSGHKTLALPPALIVAIQGQHAQTKPSSLIPAVTASKSWVICFGLFPSSKPKNARRSKAPGARLTSAGKRSGRLGAYSQNCEAARNFTLSESPILYVSTQILSQLPQTLSSDSKPNFENAPSLFSAFP